MIKLLKAFLVSDPNKSCNLCRKKGARYYGNAPEEDYEYWYCDECKGNIIFVKA